MTATLKAARTALGSLGILLRLAVTFQFGTIRRLLRVNSLFTEKNILRNFSDMRGLFFSASLPARSQQPTPLPVQAGRLPDSFRFRSTTFDVEKWKSDRAVAAMIVLRDGQIRHEEYRLGTRAEDLRISWSMAKSQLSSAFGIAEAEGLIPDLDAPVTEYVSALKHSAYDGVTIRNTLHMASGVEFNEDYLDFHSDINRMGRVLALGGSMDAFAASLKTRAWQPGSQRRYVSIDTHVIGMVLRAATGRTNKDYLTEKLFQPMGLEADPYYLTDGYGTAFVLGGMNMRTRDYARFGLMFAQDGWLNGHQIVPADWVRASTANSAPAPAPEPIVSADERTLGYGYQWWLPPEAQEGEFFAIGIYGQYIYVNQPLKTVVAVNSGDRNFKDGFGRITLENLALFRSIAEG